jgi:hypothetical protein
MVFFYSKHFRNLIKLINDLQKYQKITPKPEINPKLKKLFKVRYFFRGVFKVKKNLILTLLIIWNILT